MDAKKTKGLHRTPVAWLALLLALAGRGVDAAPIRWQPKARLAAQDSGVGRQASSSPASWADFLAGGESAWSTRPSPTYTSAVRQAVLRLIHSDPEVAAASPLIQYFVWRRNLNVARFDAYHPFIGPNLPQEITPPTPQVVPPLPTPTIPPMDPPVDPLTPPVPSVVAPQVPEPSALMVLLVGAGGTLWIRRKRESAPAA